ncbi:hypothetical protein C8J56DRAFT_1170856 [Mycena floridula]|nr:hypothetical protein C8J56DRAFT_1170856 [Mycena floridula]
MFRTIPHSLIFYYLASLTQGLTYSVPNNIHTGDTPVCTWTAGNSDPSSFTLSIIGASITTRVVNATVERNGKNSGIQDLPAVMVAGLYFLSASSNEDVLDFLGTGIQFKVTDPSTTVRTQTSIAGSVSDTSHSAIVSSTTSQPVGTAMSRITGNDASSSQDGRATSDTLSGTSSMRSTKSDATAGNTITNAGITITDDVTIDSRTRPGPTALPSDISLTSKRTNIGGLVGGIIAGVVCVILFCLWMLYRCMQHRHTTLTHPSVTVYDVTEDLDVQRRKRHWKINHQKTTHDTKTAPEESDPVSSNPVVMQRQQSLQNRAVEIDRELEESHSALSNLPDASPEFTRTLVTEIERLNQENQHLRDLTQSDWALGVTDIPPPSYSHSETSSS